MSRRELDDKDVARAAVERAFGRSPARLETAYYGGAFYWVAYWNEHEYSVADGHGGMLPADEVERLRPALEAPLTGSLLAADQVQFRRQRT